MIQWLLVGMVVTATAAGDILQATEMQRHAQSGVLHAAASIVRRPLLLASMGCMAISFGSFLMLLRVADLSFAVPATAISFVLETALAQYFLRERVDRRRWTACLLVAAGVAMLAL
jgi:drug/metabolite transporter (DMT)-like permease